MAERGPAVLEGEPLCQGTQIPSLRLGGGSWSNDLHALDHNPASSSGNWLLISYLSRRHISISMCFMLAVCLVLTTWERGTRYYHHNHRLPPACLTWTHYSCHPSPRRSLSPTPRVHISAFGRWINQMLNFKVTTSKCLGEKSQERFFPLNSALLTYFDSKHQCLCGRNFQLLLKIWFIWFYMRNYAKKVVQWVSFLYTFS